MSNYEWTTDARGNRHFTRVVKAKGRKAAAVVVEPEPVAEPVAVVEPAVEASTGTATPKKSSAKKSDG